MQIVPDTLDNLVNTTEAANTCGVGKSTVSMWVSRGRLAPSGLDVSGRPLYKLIDVLRAERATRESALGMRGRRAV